MEVRLKTLFWGLDRTDEVSNHITDEVSNHTYGKATRGLKRFSKSIN
ncbi:Uncharacterised protein [Streptococcus pneumoniae]|nr:Uncharacterised protein [Streptococcus pneumoniae]